MSAETAAGAWMLLTMIGPSFVLAAPSGEKPGETPEVLRTDSRAPYVHRITLYDEEDHVVAARTVNIAADVFLAGAIAPFEVVLTPLGKVERYDVEVQGWWIGYQVPVETDTPEATSKP